MKRKIFVFLLIPLCLSITILQAQVKGVKGKNGKWGLMDGSGKMITSYIYGYIGSYGEFYEGLATVSLNNKSGCIDSAGKVIIPIIYDECDHFERGTATVWVKGKCGLIDKMGKLIIPIGKFDFMTHTWNDSILMTQLLDKKSNKDKFGLVTKTGKELLPPIYDQIGSIINGVAMLTNLKKKGFFFVDTKLVIPCKYDETEKYKEGFASVCSNKKWGFIDINGNIAIALKYERVSPFENGKSKVWLNGESFIILNPTKQ